MFSLIIQSWTSARKVVSQSKKVFPPQSTQARQSHTSIPIDLYLVPPFTKSPWSWGIKDWASMTGAGADREPPCLAISPRRYWRHGCHDNWTPHPKSNMQAKQASCLLGSNCDMLPHTLMKQILYPQLAILFWEVVKPLGQGSELEEMSSW